MLYTIGYSNRILENFLHEIQLRRIVGLVDVRSVPRSRNPAYNRERLERSCAEAGIIYSYEGRILGGRSEFSPQDPSYEAALQRLISLSSASNFAIFCAEGEPEKCHRCYDIGAALILRFTVPAINIRRDGSEEGMTASLRRVSPKLYNPLI